MGTRDQINTDRRYRNILANSGEVMESGETRNLEQLYVMGRDGRLIKVAELATDPDLQTEDYSVKAQADHGEIVDGELTDTIEKQFGACKVWLEPDGLHARLYFADNDPLADHAWAISDSASYSTGIDWYPEGYHGTGYDIDQPIGILREISMVLTGNDPRAHTLDHIHDDDGRAHGGEPETTAAVIIQKQFKEKEMTSKDELTPKESADFKEQLTSELVNTLGKIVDNFTTDAPEDETEPTAKPGVAVAEKSEPSAEEAKTDSKDAIHNININIRDRALRNEGAVITKDAKANAKNARNSAIRDALKASNYKFDENFNRHFTDALRSKDAINGLGTPLNLTNVFTSAMEASDGIINYFYHISGSNGRGIRNNALAGAEGAGLEAAGHKKGDVKKDQALTNTIRVAYDKMVYKKLSLDAMEIYENPELLDFRAQELYEQIIVSIERAAIIGDGRTAPESGADYRMFDAATNTGLFPVAADCEATEGYGSLVASSYKAAAGDNLYDGVVGARQNIHTEGDQILIVKPSVLTKAFQAKVGDRYLIEPGATAEDIFRVARVFSPLWMESAKEDAFLLVRNGYTTTGETSPRVYPFFDVNTNSNILLNELPIGGTLTRYKSAAAITGLTA